MSKEPKPSLAPRHEHSFGVYKRYAPLLNAAIATGETYIDPVSVSKTGKLAPYTLVVALRAALAAKRKYFYKVGLSIDQVDSRDFKIRETQDGRVAIFYKGGQPEVESYILSWPKDQPKLVEILGSLTSPNSILPAVEIHALSDVEHSLRMFVAETNARFTISFQSEWVWKVERVS